MCRRISYLFIGIFLASFLCAQDADAAKHAVLLTSNEVTAHDAADPILGDSYTAEIQIPAVINGKELYAAFIEFYVDVSSVEVNGVSSRTPLIEVYALKSAFAGVVDPTQLETSSGMLINVVTGENKRAVLDITEIIKSYLESPTSNHGIIMGSLTGLRDGVFSIKSNQIAANTVARITYHYDSRVRR